ncbi:MAG: 4Fe-4S cluster-binding domain-containing protein [Magnetococcales bacterium]|nr:4Fe-4S cluster-binding domain-containing protein [Magnetococcales bacterium]
MADSAQLFDRILNSQEPIVIFGAGIVGDALAKLCAVAGVKVASICDNNINKVGKKIADIEIIHVTSMKSAYPKALLLISTADIMDVVAQLKGLGYENWLAAGPLLRSFDLNSVEFDAPFEFVDFAVSTCVMCHDGYLDPDKIFLRSVDVIITERCSLRCQDCSNLMQYYETPKDCDINEVNLAIEGLCEVVDDINEFRIIGGEPFLNKNMWQVCNALAKQPKVRKVIIYTNGAIVPKGENLACLKDDKILVLVTDYGPLTRKTATVIEIFKANGIAHYVQPAQNWTQCSNLVKHNRTVKEQTAVFTRCCAKNLFTLSAGKFFRCPFIANADRLGATPDIKSDYVQILDIDCDSKEIRKRLRNYLYSVPYLEACDYCNGRFLDDPTVTPGIQVKKPLPYKLLRQE